MWALILPFLLGSSTPPEHDFSDVKDIPLETCYVRENMSKIAVCKLPGQKEEIVWA